MMEQIASINRCSSLFKIGVKHLLSNVSLIYPDEIKNSEFVKLQKCISNVYYNKPLNYSYQDLYRSVENLCTLNQYENLYNDLHVLVKEYLYLQVLDLTCYKDCHFLHKLKELWLNYCHKSKLVKNVYLYLELYSARHCKKKISIWNMCMELFENVVLLNEIVEDKLSFVFTLIESERNGATIDTKLIKDIVCMLDKLSMYETHFENNFITTSEFYYERRRDQLLKGDILQYIYYVQSKLKEEGARVNLYLKGTTEKKLIKKLYVVLVNEELDSIFEKLENSDVFQKADEADLLHLYDLLVIHPKANTQLCVIFSKFMMQKGTKIVFDECNEKLLIQNLLDFKNRIDEIVRICFKNTHIYVEAVRTSFKKFINQRKNKPAQYLAKFINTKMREKMIPEELLDKIMVLFRYIHGKDVFEAYYKRYLSKRLLVGQSSSQDAEKYMIGKLKLECGDGFTSKLEGMFKDIDLSANLMCAFKQKFANSQAFPIEFGANVLTSSFWPTYTKYTVTLSDQMANYQTIFHEFYKSKYSGRSLQWLPALGSCLLKASLNTQKELVVSLFQALVLCLFNENDRLTYGNIKLNLNIDDSELIRTLVSLFCKQVQLLIKEPADSKVLETDQFYINKDYTHKLFRIKINQLQLKETVEEHKITEEEVLHDRHLQIDAALVRLMKQTQKMRHNELIAEMYKILKFPINPNDIKKRIEILIERDYLSRNPDDTNSYVYVA